MDPPIKIKAECGKIPLWLAGGGGSCCVRCCGAHYVELFLDTPCGTTRKSKGYLLLPRHRMIPTQRLVQLHILYAGRGRKNVFNIKYMIRTSFHVLDDQQIKGQSHKIVARGPVSTQ